MKNETTMTYKQLAAALEAEAQRTYSEDWKVTIDHGRIKINSEGKAPYRSTYPVSKLNKTVIVEGIIYLGEVWTNLNNSKEVEKLLSLLTDTHAAGRSYYYN